MCGFCKNEYKSNLLAVCNTPDIYRKYLAIPMTKQTLYLIRHGETPWTVSRQHTGRTDISLTQKGEEQVHLLGKRLQKIPFQALFCSPLKRAQETCSLCSLETPRIIAPELAEWHYGNYEGKTTAEIRETHPHWNLFTEGAPQGEKPEDVEKRVYHLLKKIELIEGNIALFSHGHLLRSLAALWLGLSIRNASCFFLSTASLSILGYEREHRALHLWNDTSHLV